MTVDENDYLTGSEKYMLFNTPDFLLFFVTVVGIYWVIPNKLKNIWLLLSSYYFYMNWNRSYALLLFGCTIVTYLAGLYIEKNRTSENRQDNIEKKIKVIFVVSLLFCLVILFIFKYTNFFIDIVNMLKPDVIAWKSELLLPVGISFYTLQSLGYLIDVYRGDIYAEKSIIKYALFISFFPQLVAGPIERSKNLLVQISTPRKFSYDNLRIGLITMLWGFFLKMVIADQAALIVDEVYENLEKYDGVQIIIACILFSIQIYCDFCGYSTIARGVAKTMGYSLTDNFAAPYYARNIKEFWRRWHISLSTWFRDYLYIPLGGNRKGNFRKNANLMIVFGVSGLWHGAAFGYIIWGLLNGLYQVIAAIIQSIRTKVDAIFGWNGSIFKGVIETLGTFCLTTIAWIFFRAGNIGKAIEVLNSIRNNGVHLINLINGSINHIGIEEGYVKVLFISIIVLFIVDYFKYRGIDVVDRFIQQYWLGRFAIELALFTAIVLFGRYGTISESSIFIYFQF